MHFMPRVALELLNLLDMVQRNNIDADVGKKIEIRVEKGVDRRITHSMLRDSKCGNTILHPKRAQH